MRIIGNELAEELLDPADCIDALETAFRELARGRAHNRPRNHTYFPMEDPDHPGFSFRFKSQEGGNWSSGVWALRITSDMAGYEELPTGEVRRRLLPLAPDEQYVGYITLYSLRTLEPLAVVHDSYVQKMRVGGTSALSIRELAREDVTTAGLFGSGWQAGAHVEHLLEVRPGIEEIAVYSPTKDHREAFAEEWSEATGRDVVAVDTPKEAVVGRDVIITATAAKDPVFDGEWLEPGTHVTCITSPDEGPGEQGKRRELDDTTFDRADVLHVTSREQVHHDDQFDILGPVERGLRDWESIRELGELLEGEAEARTSDDQITVFSNNTGMGLQFSAVCSVVYERAEERDLGHVVDTDWFLEETTP